MDPCDTAVSVFAILIPANNAARDSFSEVAQKLGDKDWNPGARKNINASKEPIQVSTYSNASESDGGTGPPAKLRPVLTGFYTFDLENAPRQPEKGWLIGGGKFSGGDERPEILLTERKKRDGVSSRHARLAHNFASGALVITASDNNFLMINGHELVDAQCVIHGRTTSLEFGNLKYILEVRKYQTDAQYRNHLKTYEQIHALGDDDYPWSLLATPADSDIVTQNYVMKNPVGSGATSVVYAGYKRKDGTAVAIKKIRRTPKNAKAIKRDIEITRYIGEHKRVCQLIDVIDPSTEDADRGYKTLGVDEVFLIYTPLAAWTIQKLIAERIVLDPQTREQIFWQLLEGIEFLHSIEVMHRDIKPLNLTVVSMSPNRPQARLIDFGLAQRGLEPDEWMVGTRHYIAPEMWAGSENRSDEKYYDDRVDIFAFGLSMYQFFCHKDCSWDRIDRDAYGFTNPSTLWELKRKILDSDNREDLKDLICNFLEWDPRLRSSARAAIAGETMMTMGKVQTIDNHDQAGRLESDGGRDKMDDVDDELGRSMGGISLSGPGRTLPNRSSGGGSSKEGPSISGSTLRYQKT